MFIDRHDAGRQLARALARYRGRKDVLILVIPRGALQIGEELHNELGAPIDIIVTKKIGHPMSGEYAIGAVGPDGEYVISEGAAGVSPDYIAQERGRLGAAVEERYRQYRGDRPKPKLAGKTVIIVDDGIATGSTMVAAIRVIRKQGPARIVAAVPVAPADGLAKVRAEADEVVCLLVPPLFHAIGQFYEKFAQVDDKEAIAILQRCQ
jgi:putative phosphoribosyl transferase